MWGGWWFVVQGKALSAHEVRSLGGGVKRRMLPSHLDMRIHVSVCMPVLTSRSN